MRRRFGFRSGGKAAFDNLDGCAVFYSSADEVYMIYNEEMGDMEVSPDSTFKILSTLIGLRGGEKLYEYQSFLGGCA